MTSVPYMQKHGKHSQTEVWKLVSIQKKMIFFALIKNWSLANRNNVPLLSAVVLRDRNECACWFSPASRFNTSSWRWMWLLQIVRRSLASRMSRIVFLSFFLWHCWNEQTKNKSAYSSSSGCLWITELKSWSRRRGWTEDIWIYQTLSGSLQEASPSNSDLTLSITQNWLWLES